MRAIRVTIDRRHEGIRVAVAMSPSVLEEVVDNAGIVSFNAASDVILDLDLEVDELDPEKAEDQLARVEFAREAEEYEPIADAG
jgi:hypothetical protein